MRRGRLAAGLLIAAAVVGGWLALVKLLVPPYWKIDPTSVLNRIYTVERDSLSRSTDPKVVILGTSRAAFGIDPETIEKTLSLERGSVINAAYPGFYDELLEQFVDRNIDYLRRAKAVVIVIDDQFALYYPTRPASYPVTPAPRWTAIMPTGSEVTAWVVSTVRRWPAPVKEWETWLSGKLPEFRKELYWTARLSRESIEKLERDYLWAMTSSGRWSWPGVDKAVFVEQPEFEKTSRLIVDQYFKGRELQQKYLEIYRRILKGLHGVQVIALDMPPAASYVRLRDQDFGELSKQQQSAFDQLFREARIPFIRCPTASACKLDERLFADPLHLNADGARRFSRVLAEMIGPLLVSER